jgi:hypothetical protein
MMRSPLLLLAPLLAVAACGGYTAPVAPRATSSRSRPRRPPRSRAPCSSSVTRARPRRTSRCSRPSSSRSTHARQAHHRLLGDNIYLRGCRTPAASAGRTRSGRSTHRSTSPSRRARRPISSPAIMTGRTWARAGGTPSSARATTSTRRERPTPAWSRAAAAPAPNTWTRARTSGS